MVHPSGRVQRFTWAVTSRSTTRPSTAADARSARAGGRPPRPSLGGRGRRASPGPAAAVGDSTAGCGRWINPQHAVVTGEGPGQLPVAERHADANGWVPNSTRSRSALIRPPPDDRSARLAPTSGIEVAATPTTIMNSAARLAEPQDVERGCHHRERRRVAQSTAVNTRAGVAAVADPETLGRRRRRHDQPHHRRQADQAGLGDVEQVLVVEDHLGAVTRDVGRDRRGPRPSHGCGPRRSSSSS